MQQELTEVLFDAGAPGLGQERGISLGLRLSMPQELAKAEGMHERFHRSTAQRSGDLTAQELRGGAADEDIHLLRVHHAADKALPPRHDLHFIEEEADPLLIAMLWELTKVLLQHPVKLRCVQASQAFVVEVEVDLCLAGCPLRDAIPLKLVEEAGLALRLSLKK
jgi:hypothetical protein